MNSIKIEITYKDETFNFESGNFSCKKDIKDILNRAYSGFKKRQKLLKHPSGNNVYTLNALEQ